MISQSKSAEALEAQREVLTHGASEGSHRRDCLSLGMLRTLEFELHSEVATQRGGFEQTRDYLQKSLNVSNEEYRKYYIVYEEDQDERSSTIREVEKKGHRQSFESETARFKSEVQNMKQDL